MALDGTPGTQIQEIDAVAAMEVRSLRAQATYRRAMGYDKEAAIEAAAEHAYERLSKMTLEDAIRSVPDSIGRQIDALFQQAYTEIAHSEVARMGLD